MSTQVPLFESAALSVFDSRCAHPRSGPGKERGGEASHLTLLARGSFRYHLGRGIYLGDPCTALLHHGKCDYRISHPGEDGDDATLISLAPGLMEELFATSSEDRPELPLAPSTQLHHMRLRAALAASVGEPLEREERTMELLEALARPGLRGLRRVRGVAQRRPVTRARELLVANLSRNLCLDALASAAGCSGFHLMRLFRAETGRSLRAYRRELRVLAALPRLAQGEQDLARIAVELGFSHHSHLADSFRHVLGVSPATLRAELFRARSARS